MATDPIHFVGRSESRLGGGDIVISLTPDQADKLGMEASVIADWFHTMLWALATLRTANSADGAVSTAALHTMITDVDHRLMPRLEGVRDALIRTLDDNGGSLGDLAIAMDVARSTAQYRRDVLRRSRPSTWEIWATGGGPTDYKPIAD